MDKDLQSMTLNLLSYCAANNWAGYEPYDALNSRIFAFPLLNSRLPRLAVTQFLKRSPINARSLLCIPRTQNPKALGLFLSALVRLSAAGITTKNDYVEHIANRLIELKSPGVSYWCWGYNFPWQTRTVLVPRWSPNLVCTTFAADGLLDVFEHEQNEKEYLSLAVSAADYLLNDLYWQSSPTIHGFDYPLPGVRNQVHNANLLAAELFCRVFRLTGEERFLAPALAVSRYTIAQQHEDGGWYYGETSSQKWIDNFHTGFNLSALRSIGLSLGTTEFEDSVSRGFQFYRRHFFREDGSVGYFHDRAYPLDAHCIAQSIITLLDLKDLDPENIDLAHSAFKWAEKHLWDEKKHYFYYRMLPFCTIRTSYMRWTQAWMLLALTRLLGAEAPAGFGTPAPEVMEVSA